MKTILVTALVACLMPLGLAATDLELHREDGSPIADVRLQVFWPPDVSGPLAALLQEPLETKTNAEGKPQAELPDGELVVVVDHPDFAPSVWSLSSSEKSRLLILRPGRPWLGRVTAAGDHDFEGSACAGWSRELPELDRIVRFERCTDLTPTGRFELNGLADGEFELTVKAAGFLPLRKRIGHKMPTDLRLEPGILLIGTVRRQGPHAAPIQGARVRGLLEQEVETDEQGRFELAVRELPTEVTAGAQGFQSRRFEMDEQAAEKEIDLRLAPGEQVTGLLRSAEPNRELESVLLRMERIEGNRRYSTTHPLTWTEEGHFRQDLPQAGTYQLSVSARRHRTLVLPPISVERGESIDLGSLHLTRGVGIRGELVGARDGEAVAGARVTLLPRGTRLFAQAVGRAESLQTVVSDEKGRFEILGLEAGGYELRIVHPQRARVTRSLDLEEGHIEDLGVVALGGGTHVTGVLVDRRDRPRPGLRIKWLEASRDSLLPIQEDVSDRQGRFELGRWAAGAYRVEVVGDRLLVAQEIDLEGEPERELELRVSGTLVRGRVVRLGEPVSGGMVTMKAALDPGEYRGKLVLSSAGEAGGDVVYGAEAGGSSARIGPDGAFELADIAPGRVRATYISETGRSTTRDVSIPDLEEAAVVVDLGGQTLQGWVLDRRSEQGLEATLRVFDSAGFVVRMIRSTSDGQFEVPDLEPGRYSVEATRTGYGRALVSEVPVQTDTPPLTVYLEPGSGNTLRVALRRPDGSPLSHVPVTLLSASGEMVSAVLTDALGQRTFESLAEGTYHLAWSDVLAGAGMSEPLYVEGGNETVFARVLPPGSTFGLSCPEDLCGGRPLMHLAIYGSAGLDVAPFLSGVSTALRFSADGTLQLGRLAPGRYHVRAWVGDRTLEKLIAVGSGDTRVSLP